MISTRYHGVLAAAWAGCKVGAIARSSKVKFLADDLGIPYVSPPLTEERIYQLYKSCVKVSRKRLTSAYDNAVSGFSYLLGLLKGE